MKRLYLLRHAKSSWDDPTWADVERPLAPRGWRAATAIGRHLAEAGAGPDHVVCSPARRALETARWVLAQLESAPEIQVCPTLYLAGWSGLLEVVRGLPDSAGRVMAVAHNPDIQALALALIGSAAPAPLRALGEKFPTGGVAVLDFEVASWRQVMPGAGLLRDFVKPRDLTVRRNE